MTDHSEPDTRVHMTKDGSHTLYSERFNQYYHNPNGAIAESRHVFLDTPGLPKRLSGAGRMSILEIGFGTGLNLLLLLELLKGMEDPPAVTYCAVEAFPIGHEKAGSLNYAGKIKLENGAEILASVFGNLKPGLNRFEPDDLLSLELFIGRFEEMPRPPQKFDTLFFDPFSPEVNPGLWTPEVFGKLAAWSRPDAVLCTYGAASAARAAMAAAGWLVARAPGALGKREMTLASLSPEPLSGFRRVDEKRLAERLRKGEFGS